LHLESVLEGPSLDHLAHRIVQVRDLADSLRHLGDPRLCQRQPIDQRLVQPLLTTGLHVGSVRLEQSFDARVDPIGQVPQPGVFLLPARAGQQVRGVLRLAAGFDYRSRGGGHRTNCRCWPCPSRDWMNGGDRKARIRTGTCGAHRNLKAGHPTRTRWETNRLELDRLDLEELLEAEASVLAAAAGLLDTAERGDRVEGGAVDLHLAGA